MLFVDRLLQTLQHQLDANQHAQLTSTETRPIAHLAAQANTRQSARARPAASSTTTFSRTRVRLHMYTVSLAPFHRRYSVLTHGLNSSRRNFWYIIANVPRFELCGLHCDLLSPVCLGIEHCFAERFGHCYVWIYHWCSSYRDRLCDKYSYVLEGSSNIIGESSLVSEYPSTDWLARRFLPMAVVARAR